MGTSGSGGGLYDCDGPITDCVIADNHCGGDGYSAGGGLSRCDGLITECVISGNTASDGLYFSTAAGAGLAACSGPIVNCTVVGNLTEGGMCGGIHGCGGQVSNCTVYGNFATSGTGAGLTGCSGPITNCIVWHNAVWSVGWSQLAGCAIPTFSCIEGWDPNQGVGNTASDPQLVDAGYYDSSSSWIEGDDYHLSAASPCINAGDPNGEYTGQSDMDGEDRVMGEGPDIGADEFLYPSLTVAILKHPEFGEVLVEPNQPWYEPNTVVSLRVVIEEGRHWAGWGGDVPAGHSFDNPLLVVMDSNKTITTEFNCGAGMVLMAPLMLVFLMTGAAMRRRK